MLSFNFYAKNCCTKLMKRLSMDFLLGPRGIFSCGAAGINVIRIAAFNDGFI